MLQVATIAPQESQALAIALAERGAELLEAPVLAALGGEPRHLGPVGAALTTKLALNQLIASLTHAFSLSLHLVQRAGVEVEAFMAILRASALHAPTFDKKLPKELADDYGNPNFPSAHLRKDLQLFLQTARGLGLETRRASMGWRRCWSAPPPPAWMTSITAPCTGSRRGSSEADRACRSRRRGWARQRPGVGYLTHRKSVGRIDWPPGPPSAFTISLCGNGTRSRLVHQNEHVVHGSENHMFMVNYPR